MSAEIQGVAKKAGASRAETQSERVKSLEDQLKVLTEKNDKSTALRDTEYIQKIQKQYETYYEKAFGTQVTMISLIGLILTVLLAIASRFGFNMFDRQIEFTIKAVAIELRSSFEQKLGAELQALENKNAEKFAIGIQDLTKRFDQAIEELRKKSEFNQFFDGGLIFAALEQLDESIRDFRKATGVYKTVRNTQILRKDQGASAIRNLFISMKRKDEAKFEENAKLELANELYKDLRDELTMAAGWFNDLTPFLPAS